MPAEPASAVTPQALRLARASGEQFNVVFLQACESLGLPGRTCLT
jgi:hypothetical protein